MIEGDAISFKNDTTVSTSLTKIFNFRHGITLNLSLSRLFKVYENINKLDYKLLSLLYLASDRFRSYTKASFPAYFSYLHPELDEYERKVENSFNTMLYDIDHDEYEMFDQTSSEGLILVVDELVEYIDTEMKMWIKWAFGKHTETQKPVHLIRYMIGTSII